MAISKIQYDDKVAINIDSTIPDINKCNASDLNEIKSVVNNNADEIPTISDEYGTSTTDGYSQNYINENTINPSGEPSTSEEDVSSATFTNTLVAPMNIDLKGNTLQNGTPTPSSPIPINNVSGDNDIVVFGKNLFDKDTGIITPGYYNASNNLMTDDTTLSCQSIYIKVKPNTKYTISSNTSTIYRICEYDINKSFIRRQYGVASTFYTITTGNTTEYIRMGGTLTTVLDSLQIEENETATTYEAYNGTTYNIDLPVENLIDVSKGRLGSYGYDFTNSNGNLVVNGTASSAVDFYFCIAGQYNDDLINYLNNRSATYTLSNDKGYEMFFRLSSGYKQTTATITPQDTIINCFIRIPAGTYNDLTIKVQLEQGNKANSYTPYGTTPIELNKIGTYQDYFYKENDKWYLHKEIGKYTFTGEENFTWDSDKQRIIIPISNLGINTPPLTTSQPFNVYNQKAIGTTFDNLYNKVVDNCFALSTGNSISIRSTSFDNLNTGKSTIANTDLYYIFQTPTNIEITYQPLINQLNAIFEAQSKEGTTNVNQVNNDLPFILDLSVFNDTYNGRYESLVEQIPNNDNLVNVGTYVNDNYKVNMLYSHNLFDKNNVNVLNAYFVDGTNNITADTSGNNKTIYIPCKPNTTYTIQKTASPSNRAIGYTTTTPAIGVAVQGAINILANTTSKSITTGNNAEYLVIRVWSGTQDTITYQQMLDSLMINEGSEALPYETYVVPSINVDGEEIYKYNPIRTIWTGANHAYNDVLNLTEQLEIGALYLVEMMAFSSAYRYYQEFMYLGYAEILQINYSSFPDDLFVRYRIEATNSSQLRIKDVKGTAGTNTDITHIYRIK